MFKKITHSLSTRIFLWMMLLLTLGFSLYAYQTVRSHTRQLMEHVFLSANRVSDVLKRSARYGMLINRKEDVHQIIQTVANEPGVDGIRVYDKKGEIIFSSLAEEIGSVVDFQAEACVICHTSQQALEALPIKNRHRVYRTAAGHRTVGVINPIENEPDCYNAACHAHHRDQKVLGVLDVRMSLRTVDEQLQHSRLEMIAFAFLTILGSGLFAGGFIYYFVRRRVRTLITGTEEIAAGNLDFRIPEMNHDELGILARSFNKMGDDLQAAHQEITEWSGSLEEKVRQKTRELSDVQSNLMRMERLASLGKLSATVAHEINNPLAGVLNYAYLSLRLLRDEQLSEERKKRLEEYLTFIRNEVARSGDIVKNMLIFAKQTGGNFAPERLHALIDSSIMLVNHHMELKEIRVTKKLSLADDGVVCDAGQIRQALLALFVNAIEAMENGGMLTVATDHAEPAGKIKITIGDSGAGIPHDIMPLIFDPFFSTKKEGKGVGLGLAVVFGIIQRHQGTIEVDSRLDQGTTFTITLPRQPISDSEVSISKQVISDI